MNVIEIDAASNNGVDNIRQIREEVEYRPTEGRFKVYIIDEVHMLSQGAFNALLKTLEEPPSYVIFILATTEAHKIPITILSRCQRYDFKRISLGTITARLEELMESEGVSVENKALRYVARAADGSMRDALSLLDQCIAFYLGQELTYEKVLNTLGAADTETFSKLLRSIIDQDVAGAIGILESMVIEGKDLGQFVTDFTWYLRNLMLAQNSDDIEDVLDISSENLAAIKEEADMADSETVIRYIRIFSELSNRIRYETQKRVVIEVALIKLCRPQMEKDYSSLVDRIDSLERKVEKGIVMAPGCARQGGINAEPPPKVELPKAIPEDIKQVIIEWNSIISELGSLSGAYLKKAVRSLGPNDSLLLVFDDELEYDYISENRSDVLVALQQLIEERIGKTVDIQCKFNDSGYLGKEVYPDLGELINAEIVEEDD
jgi:DNA polymerase-3 subunit gamma/tau